MPAGGHSILGQTRQAVEERARAVLAQLQELEGASVAPGEDHEEMAPCSQVVSANQSLGTQMPQGNSEQAEQSDHRR
jgi:hypothetical protein